MDEVRKDPNATVNGPSWARQRNADDGPILNAGLVDFFYSIRTSIAKKTYIFVIIQGGGGVGSEPPIPPLDPHMNT